MLLDLLAIRGQVVKKSKNRIAFIYAPTRIVPTRSVRQKPEEETGCCSKNSLEGNGKSLKSVGNLEDKNLSMIAAYPRKLIIHTSEAKVNPVRDGNTGDEPSALLRNLRSSLGGFDSHLGL